MNNKPQKVSPWDEYFKKNEELIKKAEALVRERITGTRKGLPDEQNYRHSFRVRDIVSECHHWDDPDYDLFIAALLHDIVEDGKVTFDELQNMGFSDRTIDLVRLCSHRMDIKDSTQRWVLMIAKLIEAHDDDAWRIKLADLTDNLAQSSGLLIENRRFMIEVKAPMLLRLAHVPYSAHYKLGEVMEKQRVEFSKQSQYVVTRWTETYDMDGPMKDFVVIGKFDDRAESMVRAATSADDFTRSQLDSKVDWNPVERDNAVRQSFSKPNKYNKIVFSRSVSRKDKTGYNSIYAYFEVIEIPYDTDADERLFNVQDCGYEVSRFFEDSCRSQEEKDVLLNLKRNRKQPIQCHLWQKEELSDGDLDNAFDVIQTFSEDSHFSRRVITCKQCGQLYLKEFYEEIDWVDGEDPQYVTYIPISGIEEAEMINRVGLWEFQTFSPRINRNWPKDKPRKIYWIGRVRPEA